jgi:LAO/AO transport system kinase
MKLVQDLMAGDVRALARAISMVDENAPTAVDVLQEVFPHTGRATVVGITGSPGAGKSSLVDRLVASYRAEGRKVGVVAVDPSSAYSGGAILGDRVRMQGHATDPGVFIRSLATRGWLGGLSRSTSDAVDLLDAAGYDPVIVETVGVGQDEIEVVRASDVVCVLLVPGMGDDIQAIKAGILEIADLFVVNKADLPGADRLVSEIRYMLSLVAHEDRDKPAILRTVAVRNEGIGELKAGIRDTLERRGTERRMQRRREQAEVRLRTVLSDRLLRMVLDRALSHGDLERFVGEIAERRTDPYSAARRILEKVEVR